MLNTTMHRIFHLCFAAIGGAENGDVHYVLERRPKETSRDDFFGEAVCAIPVSGFSSKSAAAVTARLEDAGFEWGIREAAVSTDAEWQTFLARVYCIAGQDEVASQAYFSPRAFLKATNASSTASR